MSIRRFGFGVFGTFALMVGGMIYQRVFVAELLPIVDADGTFSQPVLWMDNLVPVILVGLGIALWTWVIAGAVQSERVTEQRRRRVR